LIVATNGSTRLQGVVRDQCLQTRGELAGSRRDAFETARELLFARNDESAMRTLRAGGGRNQLVNDRHDLVRVRDHLRVFIEAHDTQVTHDPDRAEQRECDRESHADLALGGGLVGRQRIACRTAAPPVEIREQHADQHAFEQHEQPLREIERLLEPERADGWQDV
jgi:hypothetical protein